MKIVVVGTRGIPHIMGGVETHCEELFPRLAALGFDVAVIRRSNYVHDKLSSWNGVQLITLKAPKKKSFEAIVHTFRAIHTAKKMKADILHVHAIGPALLIPYAKLLGLRVVFTHHGPDYDRDKWGRLAKEILKLGERMGCKFADDVIVISKTIQNIIAQKYNRTQRVHLIYNGVPKPTPYEYPEYFKELGIEKGKYILGMGRFVPEKNLHHLIEAFTFIQPKGFRLVLAGDADFNDSYVTKLKEMANKHNVVLTGFIKGKKLQSLLSNCSCFCLPSSHEGLPIALLEAMSYQAQVVVSDIPANTEIGLPPSSYFHTGDLKELSHKLQMIVDSPVVSINYDMQKYDWDSIAKQVCDVYNR